MEEDTERRRGDGRGKGVRAAIRDAWRKLSSRDLLSVTRGSQAESIGPTRLGVGFAGESYVVDLSRKQMRDEKGIPASDKRELLILHYLLGAKELEPCGEVIGFSGIAEARTYTPVFKARTVGRLLRSFGESPARLLEAARPMGGVPCDAGDVCVGLRLFPRIPVTIIIWGGSEEFAPSGNIVFDRTVTEHLPIEDIVVACEELVGALIGGRSS